MNENMRPFARITFISHLAVGALGAMAAIRIPGVSPLLMFGIGLAAAAAAACVGSRFCQLVLLNGLELVEQSVVTSEKPAGKTEFHATADNIVTHVSRLAAAAAKGREQSREVEHVLSAFDRRGSNELKSSPSRQLSLQLKSLGRDVRTSIDAISLIGSDMQAHRVQMITAANDEFELVKTAAGEVGDLANSVAAVSEYAKRAKASDVSTFSQSESVSQQLLSLQNQLEQLRDQIGIHDKKNQSLRDQTAEIASLVQTIHDFSAKTDTLALNASIESVRAGEHGLSFATAADEIRKMTQIISDSTRDALDRIKLVEDGVEDATSDCAQSQAAVETPMTTTRALSQSLSEIRQSTNESRVHLDRLLESTDAQLRNLNVVAGALGGVFESAERAASQADEELRIQSDLKDKLFELSSLLMPLAGNLGQPAQAEQAANPSSVAAANGPPPQQPIPVTSDE